jgi:hypothetical protein
VKKKNKDKVELYKEEKRKKKQEVRVGVMWGGWGVRRSESHRGLSFHPLLFFFIIEKTLITTRNWPHATNRTAGFWDLKRKKYFSSFNLS